MWEDCERDTQIACLIKSIKREHLESTLCEGKLCFNFPTTFRNSSNLYSAQADAKDANIFFQAYHLVFAPIVKEDNHGIQYGEGCEVAKEAQIFMQSNESKQTPICCFRIVDNEELSVYDGVYCLKLGEIADRIRAEFGHDSFIMITDVVTFLNRINSIAPCHARSVHYGEMNSEFHPEFNQRLAMFQKRTEYEWQKEYRIILDPREGSGPQFVNIGDMRDIAFGGSIEMLRDGIAFSASETQLTEFLKNHNMSHTRRPTRA